MSVASGENNIGHFSCLEPTSISNADNTDTNISDKGNG